MTEIDLRRNRRNRKIHVLESDEVLAADITHLADVVGEAPFVYRATNSEIKALEWIADRYAITELLWESFFSTQPRLIRYYIKIDPMEVQEALAADGVDRVPCLDESTALARIIWAIGPAMITDDYFDRFSG